MGVNGLWWTGVLSKVYSLPVPHGLWTLITISNKMAKILDEWISVDSIFINIKVTSFCSLKPSWLIISGHFCPIQNVKINEWPLRWLLSL